MAKKELVRVRVFLQNEEGKYLVLYRKYSEKKVIMCLPGGGVEEGEDPLAALHRVVQEEVSLHLKSPVHIGDHYVPDVYEGYENTRFRFTRFRFYSAGWDGKVFMPPEKADKHSGYEWLSKTDIESSLPLKAGRCTEYGHGIVTMLT